MATPKGLADDYNKTTPKSYADDFNERVTKKCLPLFRERVLPTHILPYLTCLDRVDKEVVGAQHKQLGDTLAADVLFDRLIQKVDWFEDLIQALRNPNVSLADLADTFTSFILIVPVRWEIGSFEDNFGKSCFSENCHPTDPVETNNEGMPQTIENRDKRVEDVINEQNRKRTNDDILQSDTASENKLEELKPDVNDPAVDMSITGTKEVTSKTKQKKPEEMVTHSYSNQTDQSQETLNRRREQIRLDMMTKLLGHVQGPADVPVALMYLTKFNLQINCVGKGSILFSIQVQSLADLKQLQKSLRSGEIEKLLNKELLSAQKVKILQELAQSDGHPIWDIRSHVVIHEADIQRCKSWLTKSHLEPVYILDGLALSSATSLKDAQDRLRVSKYVRDRLPECHRRIAEDPFLLDRMNRFYNLKELRQKIEGDTNGKFNGDHTSVAEMFLRWFDFEMTEYLKTLGKETMQAVFIAAFLMFEFMSCKDIHFISVPLQKGTYHVAPNPGLNVTVTYDRKEQLNLALLGKIGKSNCFRYIEDLGTVSVEYGKIENMFKLLVNLGILRSYPPGYSFASDLLRDVFVTTFVKGEDSPKTNQVIQSKLFPFLPSMMGLYFPERADISTDTLLQYSDYSSTSRAVTELKYTPISQNELDVPDIFCSKPMTFVNNFHVKLMDEAKHMVNVGTLKKNVSKHVDIDLSKETYGEELDEHRLQNALKWLNVLDCASNLSQLEPFRCFWRSEKPLHISARTFEGLNNTEKDHFKLGSTTSILTFREGHYTPSRKLSTSENVETVGYPTPIIQQSDDIPANEDNDVQNRMKIETDTEFKYPGNILSSPRQSSYRNTEHIPVDEVNDVKMISLNISGHTFALTHFQHVSNYFGVTPSLSRIHLEACRLHEASIKDVFKTGRFENISHLNISKNVDLGTELTGSLGIRFLVNLESLDIHNCNLGDNGIVLLSDDLKRLKKIKKVNVAHNRMTAYGLLELSTALTARTGITSLRLQQNPIEEKGSMILASWLKRLVLLEVLNINECGIESDSIEHIAKSVISNSLRKLSIRNKKEPPKGVRCFLQKFPRPPFLGHLEFSNYMLYDPNGGDTDVTVDVETFFKSLYPWNHIGMWKCYLGFGRMFKEVDQYKSLSELTYLSLQENFIKDIFAEDLALCIKTHCNLIMLLNLRQNQIENNGALALASSFRNKRYLEEVLLDRNNIGQEGAEGLVKSFGNLSEFKILDLSCNSLSVPQAEHIAQGIAACAVDTESAEPKKTVPNVFILKKTEGIMYSDIKEASYE